MTEEPYCFHKYGVPLHICLAHTTQWGFGGVVCLKEQWLWVGWLSIKFEWEM